jgi:ubiquinone/menaquinone biosynthesis C-methylase UbiE
MKALSHGRGFPGTHAATTSHTGVGTLPLHRPLCNTLRLRRSAMHSQVEYAFTLLEHLQPGIEWLDIGCGRQVVPDWVWSPAQARALLRDANLTGLDMDAAMDEHPLLRRRLRCWADDIPVPHNSFDFVSANMVLEHVKDPGGVLREIRRVLRPGGSFLIHTPNLRFYLMQIARCIPQGLKNRIVHWLEHREDKDIFPTCYRFNTPESIERYAAESGLSIASLRFTGPTPSFLGTPLEPLERPILALLRRPAFKRYRSNLIVELKKPEDSASLARHQASRLSA